MSADPLAEIVAFAILDNEMLPDVVVSPGSVVCDERGADALGVVVAESLRANRDRVLEALGGEQGVYDLEVLGPTILWLFPEGLGE